MVALTPAERRGGLVIVALLLIGAGWDVWRAHAPPAPAPHELVANAAPAPAPAMPPPDTSGMAPASLASGAGRVDLNRASAQELDALPGIGPVLADRIVHHRMEHGPFRRVEDLAAVRGIGPRALERLRPRVVVASR